MAFELRTHILLKNFKAFISIIWEFPVIATVIGNAFTTNRHTLSLFVDQQKTTFI